MSIDPEKCSGCRICEYICSLSKRTSAKKPRTKIINSALSRIRIIQRQMKNICVPIFCFKCESPLCIDVCPLEALYKDSKGIIKVDNNACIGCKLCSYICPLGAIIFDPKLNKIEV